MAAARPAPRHLRPNNAITDNAYNFNKILQTVWTGVKWSVRDNLDLSLGLYHQGQNNYNFTVTNGFTLSAPCAGGGAFVSSSRCAGSQDAFSIMADWRPFKRIDVYGGVMLSNVYGGLANGFYSTATYAVPVGGRSFRRLRRHAPHAGIRSNDWRAHSLLTMTGSHFAIALEGGV